MKYAARNIVLMLFVLFVSCKNKTVPQEKHEVKQSAVADTLRKIFGTRDTVIADVDGDKVPDTLIESYISRLTGKETYMVMDSVDFDNNVTLTVKNEPICKLYSLNRKFDTLLISDELQLRGLYFAENLGDLNNDGNDEIGYVVDYADWSNINSYHITTYKKDKNKWEELANFSINEGINFEPEQLYKGKSFVKKIGLKKIKVKYYTDDAEPGEKVIVFK